ncbi:transposase [uncultured Turicimonas sp.]
MRKKKYRSIRSQLWSTTLWSPSYFIASCGGSPTSIINQYIEQQNTPD